MVGRADPRAGMALPAAAVGGVGATARGRAARVVRRGRRARPRLLPASRRTPREGGGAAGQPREGGGAAGQPREGGGAAGQPREGGGAAGQPRPGGREGAAGQPPRRDGRRRRGHGQPRPEGAGQLRAPKEAGPPAAKEARRPVPRPQPRGGPRDAGGPPAHLAAAPEPGEARGRGGARELEPWDGGPEPEPPDEAELGAAADEADGEAPPLRLLEEPVLPRDPDGEDVFADLEESAGSPRACCATRSG